MRGSFQKKPSRQYFPVFQNIAFLHVHQCDKMDSGVYLCNKLEKPFVLLQETIYLKLNHVFVTCYNQLLRYGFDVAYLHNIVVKLRVLSHVLVNS